MKKILSMAMVVVMVLGMAAFAAAAELPAIEKTDRFYLIDTIGGLSMVSYDGGLVIHVGDGTEIVFEDGIDVHKYLTDGLTLAELLDGRNLVVTYSYTTRSFPPQTTPEKIVILYEIAVNPIYTFETAATLPAGIGELPGTVAPPLIETCEPQIGIVPPIYEFEKPVTLPAGIGELPGAVEIAPPIYEFQKPATLPADIADLLGVLNGEIVVDGKIIEAPAPYYSNGVIMVPARAIAEALGYEIKWDGELQGIGLGVAINFWIGKDYYTVGKMAPIALGTAPELTDGFTFVPLSFFSGVVTGYDAYSFEGQIVIGAAGDMQ